MSRCIHVYPLWRGTMAVYRFLASAYIELCTYMYFCMYVCMYCDKRIINQLDLSALTSLIG